MNHQIMHVLAHLAKEGILKVQENLNCHCCDTTNFGGWHQYGCCYRWQCGSCKAQTVRTGRCSGCGKEANYK